MLGVETCPSQIGKPFRGLILLFSQLGYKNQAADIADLKDPCLQNAESQCLKFSRSLCDPHLDSCKEPFQLAPAQTLWEQSGGRSQKRHCTNCFQLQNLVFDETMISSHILF